VTTADAGRAPRGAAIVPKWATDESRDACNIRHIASLLSARVSYCCDFFSLDAFMFDAVDR